MHVDEELFEKDRSQFSSSLGRLGSGVGLGVRSLGTGGGSEMLLGFSVFVSSEEEGVRSFIII